MDGSDGSRPEVTYPCRWGYRVIGASEGALRALIADVCGKHAYEIHSTRPSRAGTYVAVHVTVLVTSEVHRVGLYTRLAEAEAVRLVL